MRWSHLFKNLPVCCYPHNQRLYRSQSKGKCLFGTLLLFYDSMDVGNFISGSSTCSKYSSSISKFSAHVLLKPSLENFEHYFANMCVECNCAVV